MPYTPLLAFFGRVLMRVDVDVIIYLLGSRRVELVRRRRSQYCLPHSAKGVFPIYLLPFSL